MAGGTPPREGKRPSDGSWEDGTSTSQKPNSSRKRRKRRNTDTEALAHLHPLQDYLKEGLDVVFCGINPGRMSAETGHHFANPTNHFWRCLHRSGLTSRLLPASDDYSLPDTYNLGLTNVVDRPSVEAADLSKSEMKAALPTLLQKISRFKPRFVCFVGMGIWEVIQIALSQMTMPSATVSQAARPVQQKTSKDGKNKANERKKGSGLGLQSYKFVYPADADGKVSETLIFVVPSTSGRVVRYQLTDKIAYFAELYALLHQSITSAEDLLPIKMEAQD